MLVSPFIKRHPTGIAINYKDKTFAVYEYKSKIITKSI